MKLFVCTTGLFTPNAFGKFEYLRQMIGSLKLLHCEQITLHIHTNVMDPTLLKNKLQTIDQFADKRFLLQWHEIIIPSNNYYELTWQHKNYLHEFLDSNCDLFLYTEFDYFWYNHHFEYFLNTRKKFLAQGLSFIPGFIRTEITPSYQVMAIDYKEPVNW